METEDKINLPTISHSTFQDSIELTETVAVAEKVKSFSSDMCSENGCLTVQGETDIDNPKGVKRPRMVLGEEQPSVRIIYHNLTRETKRKLEELMQQWSKRSAEHGPSLLDSEEVLESGEETYFPALRVGVDKPCAVSFWMDDLPRKKKNKEFTPFDANSVSLYDRGYSFALSSTDGSSNLEGGMEVVNASRCFNCGSYSHSLKDCPKPFDNVAVNIAKKEHKYKRNKNAPSHNHSRYYRSSKKGKYDGLRPGALDPETRKLLGLGELDPPPWIHRMQEIGHPPVYLGPEDKDLPSGITIYGDAEIEEETEEGEILQNSAEPPKKTRTEFPGTNAPIPDNLKNEQQRAAGPSSFTASRTHSYSSRYIKTDHYLEQQRSRDMDFEHEGPSQWRFRDFEDEGHLPHWRFRDTEYEGHPRPWFGDEGPPQWQFRGIEGEGPPQRWFRDFEGDPLTLRWFPFKDEWPRDLDIPPSPYRNRGFESNYGPIDGFGRSLSDRMGRSPVAEDHSFFHNLYQRY